MKAEIEKFLCYCENNDQKSHNTINGYRTELQQFCEYVNDKPIEEVTKQDYVGFIEQATRSGNKANTIRHKIAAIKSLWAYAENIAELPITDIIKGVKPPKIEKKIVQAFDLHQIENLLSAVRNDGENPFNQSRNYLMINIFLNCGLRASELTDIKISDINFTQNSILINGKGKKQRIVYFNDEIKELVRNFIYGERTKHRYSTSPYLFFSNKSEKMGYHNILLMINHWYKIAGLDEKQVGCHKLRKSFATELRKQGTDIVTISELLGHSSADTTLIYLQEDEKAKKEAVQRLKFN